MLVQGWSAPQTFGKMREAKGSEAFQVDQVHGRPDENLPVESRLTPHGALLFAPLAERLATEAQRHAPHATQLVEVGAGTGYYAARILDRLGRASGQAIDLSKCAARRAARAHLRLGSVIADVNRLPLASHSTDLLLDVFAPRNALEFRRVLRAGSVLLMALPTSRHLAGLRAELGLLGIDPEKERRLEGAFMPEFEQVSTHEEAWSMTLNREAVLVSMGPSARHIPIETLTRRVEASRAG